eukprot:COSAG01_NODE_7267_length_3276_cov_1.775574_1_plen_35_part_10
MWLTVAKRRVSHYGCSERQMLSSLLVGLSRGKVAL